MATWRELINEELEKHKESFSDITSITLSEEELNKDFDDGYGRAHGKPFTAWTHRRVYFPVSYDGAEWVGSVSRIKDGIATEHIGCTH